MKHEAAANPEKLRDAIRASGLRCTAARLAVLQHLATASRPLTHAEVADQLNGKNFDRATIYRNLMELTEVGLAARIELGDHVWRFEVKRADHSEANEHPHFVCVDCGEVSCLPSESVRFTPPPASKANARSRVTEVLIKGHCGECS
ncbi:MAG TPA: transcriptional repressor [Pirellulales bacterium]|nr:transcriptional repressor [Pirellulales bacterium]